MTVDIPEPEIRAELATFGWIPWNEATVLLGASGATWLGPSGVVRWSGPEWPSDLPLTTRLHAWDGAALRWRLIPRPGLGTVLVTCLGDIGTSWPGTPRTREVTCTRVPAGEWVRTWVQDLAHIMFLQHRDPAGGPSHDGDD